MGRIINKDPRTTVYSNLPSNTLYRVNGKVYRLKNRGPAQFLPRYKGQELDALDSKILEERILIWKSESRRLDRRLANNAFCQSSNNSAVKLRDERPDKRTYEQEDKPPPLQADYRAKCPYRHMGQSYPFGDRVDLHLSNTMKEADCSGEVERRTGRTKNSCWKQLKESIQRRFEVTKFGTQLQGKLMLKRVEEKKFQWKNKKIFSK